MKKYIAPELEVELYSLNGAIAGACGKTTEGKGGANMSNVSFSAGACYGYGVQGATEVTDPFSTDPKATIAVNDATEFYGTPLHGENDCDCYTTGATS